MSDQSLHTLYLEIAISFCRQENRIYTETVEKIV